jgi:hypothetical protein
MQTQINKIKSAILFVAITFSMFTMQAQTPKTVWNLDNSHSAVKFLVPI